ncbi:MAG: type II toxin-antitoxin system Phd/YefM family antitoxin [Pseudolactococcus laudensis]|uniref:Antitoxin n=1 Tax=Pseudolactococcus laudensis TaxID=1494461 RepID=A0A7V8MZP9_9LACT|nr:type II toxin-antitoxin system Phd/YefM family antitoxin [Lactococcus laudensis]MBA0015971.1 type II toxin-antitoxin system Phd/YefM family antitoxin [Lactococcus laudensis]MBQ6144681.1 type II toxin-antitoxin system Phd/YefM family antitoxin [Lactococcus sp.]MBW9282220.1 type II toxin-antitoxin system prevent-host-death family antitoxin [Lactococcus laudensis]
MSITATTPTNIRKNIFSILADVTENDTELHIVNSKGKNAVLISESSLNSLNETLHLLSSKNNRNRLDSAMAQFNQGKGTIHELIEVEDD